MISANPLDSAIESGTTRVTLPPGTRLGHYEIVSLLGAGRMGEVYLARDTRPALAREVAIKILLGASTDEESRRRFEQEARATSALNHPNILAIYDVAHTRARSTWSRSSSTA